MIKVYFFLLLAGILAGIGYAAKYYYDTTQSTIAVLRENNAQLEVAVQTANESLELVQSENKKFAELNNALQNKLQRAEAYSDELRGKFANLDLVLEAMKDAQSLEGKMNGATAKLWREFMADTGNTNTYDKPQWLLDMEAARDGNQNSNESGETPSTSGVETETAPVN
jgi:FtsZ-binding cell division protein ZapB